MTPKTEKDLRNYRRAILLLVLVILAMGAEIYRLNARVEFFRTSLQAVSDELFKDRQVEGLGRKQ